VAIITISRYAATGGRELGRLLAKKFNYQYVDKSLFQQIAEDLNVSERTLESYEKSREYRISNIFSKLFSKSYIDRIVGHDKSIVEEIEYQTSLKKLILGVAQEDNVVIIGRAANFFLKDYENCFSFNLVAPMDWRIKYAVQKLGMAQDKIQAVLEKKDRNHLMFLQALCGKDFDDTQWSHLTINMSCLPIEKTTDVIVSVANLIERA
jgi:cytidylate kinase